MLKTLLKIVTDSIHNQKHGLLVDSIKIINTRIPNNENVFTYNKNQYTALNKGQLVYGASHGINKQFFTCFEYCCDKLNNDSVLLLEPDCNVTCDNWFDKCIDYVQSNDEYIVAGSKYKGLANLRQDKDHINGVAIYRLDKFKHVLKGTKDWLREYIRVGAEWICNFDIAIYRWAKLNNKWNDKSFVDTKIITNVSPSVDMSTPVDQVLKQNPETIVLHKK